ncbi:FAD-binding oxidoreductase [Aspergillus undulatus]|uniref:FAD-binding oxidoreductase n=1 Tax=Aspergillus undulatus TaxID=1810928 RepID=UPI003CCD580F
MVAFSAIFQTALGLSAAKDLTSLFGPYLSPQAEIFYGNDTDFYVQLQQRWTDYKAPSYGAGAIKPATAKDVQNIVKIANANSIRFFVTGGGHGISDYHEFDGLSIDMAKFNTVERNAAGDRLTIGGLPLGSCACVGVVGATLGGGIGSLHGLRGLLVDYLEEVEVVTASGDLVKASETENKDLFWALRGAGSNYGIVTSAMYRLPEVTNKGVYVNADYVFPVSANESFFEVLEHFDNTLPSRLAITGASFFDRVNNKPVIAVNAVFFGSLEEALPYLQPFESLQPQMMDAAFFNFFGMDNGACTPNQHINIYTVALKQFHAPTFLSFYSRLRYSNEGPMAVPDDATAYAFRDVKTYMNIEGFYADSSLDDAVNEFATLGRQEFAKTSGFDQLAVYSNYARGDEGPIAWYGERKLPMLSALKRKWDPEQRFSVNNPVPLHWRSEL